MSNQSLIELQLLEKNLARTVSEVELRDRNANDHKRDLHWFSISSSTGYKIATLCYSVHRLAEVGCILALLHQYAPRRSQQSLHRGLLVAPPSRTKTARHRLFDHSPQSGAVSRLTFLPRILRLFSAELPLSGIVTA